MRTCRRRVHFMREPSHRKCCQSALKALFRSLCCKVQGRSVGHVLDGIEANRLSPHLILRRVVWCGGRRRCWRLGSCLTVRTRRLGWAGGAVGVARPTTPSTRRGRRSWRAGTLGPTTTAPVRGGAALSCSVSTPTKARRFLTKTSQAAFWKPGSIRLSRRGACGVGR